MNKKILWVEDNPQKELEAFHHFIDVRRFYEDTCLVQSLDAALEQIAQQPKFDLVILDADFPSSNYESRVLEVLRYFENSLDEKVDFDDMNMPKRTPDEWVDWNNFVNLYGEGKPFGEEDNVVVYSLSSDAANHAFKLGLPYFHKYPVLSETREEVKEKILRGVRRHLKFSGPTDDETEERIAKWVCGYSDHLFEDYLGNYRKEN